VSAGVGVVTEGRLPLPGERLHALFLCIRRSVHTTRSGRRVLTVGLADRGFVLEGWTTYNVDRHLQSFDFEEVVEAVGTVTFLEGRLGLRLSSIIRTNERAPESFLPVAKRDLDELGGFFEHFAREEVSDEGYRTLLAELLADRELMEAFRRAPCTLTGHHAYRGGALEHTVAVAMLARELCDLHPALERDLLVTAALVHEIGVTAAFGARTGCAVKVPAAALRAVLVQAADASSLSADRRVALGACLGLGSHIASTRWRLEQGALEWTCTLDAEVAALKAIGRPRAGDRVARG
jgi:3'-5' exoribonuclease